MSIGDRYRAAMASCRLQRNLTRKNPDVFVYGGITVNEPFVILIRATDGIDVPDTFVHEGDEYKVEFEIR